MNNQIFKKLSSNFLYLGVFQVANLIFPLLISPFLITKIGIAKFGLIASAQALMTFFNIICDYGFNLSATKDISLNFNKFNKISLIFSSVMHTKFLLLILSCILNVLVILVVPVFHQYAYLYILSFSITLGRVFFPVWFFQGIQKMQYLIYYSFFSKGLAALLIVFFIKEESNFESVNLIIGLTDFLGSLLIIAIIFKRFKLVYINPKYALIKLQLKKGFFLFLANFFANICGNSNILILNAFVDSQTLGIYAVPEKVYQIIKQLPTIIFQAVYPHACNLWVKSKFEFEKFIKKLYLMIGLSMAFFSVVTAFFAKMIISFFSVKYVNEMSFILYFMAFLPIIAGLNLPSFIVVLLKEKTKISSRIIVVASTATIVVSFILTPIIGYWGAIVSILIADLIITTGHFVIAKYR